MSAQSQEFNDHLDGEDHGEDHVEDVHDGGEEFGLFVMLTERHSQTVKYISNITMYLCMCVCV